MNMVVALRSGCLAFLTMFVAGCGGGSDGGSGSSAPTLTAVTLTSLSPESATAGSAAMEITAAGTGFTTSSVVEWNGASLATNYISSSALTATVPAADLATAGTASVTVSGGTTGSASSGVVHFTVNTQTAPVISSLAPSSITAGGAAFQLLVTGTHFTASASVLWNGRAVPTTFDSAAQLTAQITAAQIATAATVPVTVVDDAAEGGTSNPSTFTISSVLPVAAPTITTLAPANATAGGAAFQLLITGTNFSASASVLWNGRAVPTTFDSATRLTAQITAAQIATAASVPVTVFNGASAGGTSNASVFTISAAPPVPTLTTLSPSSLPVNAVPVTLTFTGTHFTPTTLLVINGAIYGATYVSSTKIEFPNFAMNYGAGSQVVFTVQDPASGNVNSNALVLKITPAIPVITSISPATVTVGQGALSLAVTGQYFTATSVVYFNGTAVPTTLNNQGQLIAQLTATDFAAPRTAKITVEDPASGNVASNSVNLTIQALPPISLTSLSPATVPAGNVAFLLTVHRVLDQLSHRVERHESYDHVRVGNHGAGIDHRRSSGERRHGVGDGGQSGEPRRHLLAAHVDHRRAVGRCRLLSNRQRAQRLDDIQDREPPRCRQLVLQSRRHTVLRIDCRAACVCSGFDKQQ